MAESNSKRIIKKTVKKSLILTKKVLSKSKTARRVGRGMRNVLFPGGPMPNIYDHHRYEPTIADYRHQIDTWKDLKFKPLISIVMPTYNTPPEYLEACIESVLIQSYSNWELCIADDASPNANVVPVLKKYAAKDARIKYMVRKKNGHISAATNSAIELASGEFIALLDHDDVLWPNALYEVVAAMQDDPKHVDLIYTDEDKIDENGTIHSYPVFKPKWSPEFLESCNYITHFACIRAEVVRQVGGLGIGFEGAQDWDLCMRITEITDRIVHVPKVLYSWRIHQASTALSTDTKPYVYEAQHKLLEGHVERSGRQALVKTGIITQHCSIEYAVEGNPRVSVIIYEHSPELFSQAIESFVRRTSYVNVEVYLAPTSSPGMTVAQKWYHRFPEWKVAFESSYATSVNHAAKHACGDFVVLIDGNMTLQTEHWLELMLGDAQRPGIGAVGGKTVNTAKDRIMRAGIGLGVYGLYAPLLEGMEVNDVHYMRGLYGQSRRNTSAVDSGCLMLRAEDLRNHPLNPKLDDMAIVDLCLNLVEAGTRIVYNPFIVTSDLANLTAGDADQKRDPKAAAAFKKKWATYIENDPYLDPGFTRANAQLDIN